MNLPLNVYLWSKVARKFLTTELKAHISSFVMLQTLTVLPKPKFLDLNLLENCLCVSESSVTVFRD